MSVFKIKLEDKAAFLNRMEKAGVELNTNQMVDNKLEGYFEATIDEPKQLEVATSILKQSPKINTIKEMENKKKMTKDELKEMVRQELQAVLAEKKKVKDEEKKEKLDESEELDESLFMDALPILATILGVGGSIGVALVKDLKNAKTPEDKKRVLQSIAGQISKSKGIEN
jgi:membrane-associated HD superfamily phosphohydrolase